MLTSNDQVSRGGNEPQPVVSDSSRLVCLALAVILMGWLSSVGVIQHLRRNIISSGRRHQGGLDPGADLVQGRPFPVTLDCSTRWWWKVYVDNLDIGEIFGRGVAAEVIHTESLSQAVYREALDSLGVPRAADKGASREVVGITMGSVIHGIRGQAGSVFRGSRSRLEGDRPIPRLATNLHDLCRRASQLHLHCMVPLIYTDMRAQLSSRVFCTDASEFGGGACETIGLTTGRWRRAVKKPYGLEVRVQVKFQQKSRLRRWCWGSSGVQTTGALMCVSICNCPSDQTRGLGPRSARKGGIGKSF